MLTTLSIRDFVLIKNLTGSFALGLGVLTGETGGGKSILLDALNLAIGGRGDSSIIAGEAKQASISAEFSLDPSHYSFDLLEEQGLSVDPAQGQLILRRTISRDGRSKAFVNDEPVTIKFLKILGDALVEIHGQHDDRGLLNPGGHRALLDAFGGHEDLLDGLGSLYNELCVARKALEKLNNELKKRQEEEEYDRHCFTELDVLKPIRGEEESLATSRKLMIEGEKSADQVNEVLTMLNEGDGVEMTIRSALRRLERLPDDLKEPLTPTIKALARGANETEEGLAQLNKISETLVFDQEKLEKTEERLFELRALARKHKCQVDQLPEVYETLRAKISVLEESDEALAAAKETVKALEEKFEKAALKLTKARGKAADRLDAGVKKELRPLKLEKARFRTVTLSLPKENWNASGAERVEFEVSTNPGASFGPLTKIASGGELSRFILALKVVLAKAGSAPTLIFDEIDRGVGGAVANAVGERLSRLSEGSQVLVVTHSPQVAARANAHFQVGKSSRNGATETTITTLDDKARREEIARMLSGAKVTDKARAAAGSLISGEA